MALLGDLGLAGGGLAAALVVVVLAWRGRPRLAAGLLAVYLVSLAWFLLTPLLHAAGWGFPQEQGAFLIYNYVANTALAGFAVVYARQPLVGRRRWELLWALIPGLFVLGAAALRPAMFWGPLMEPSGVAVNLARFLHNFAAFLGVILFGARLLGIRAGPLRRSLAFAFLAFAGFAINHIFADAAKVAGTIQAWGSSSPPVVALSVASGAALSGFAWMAGRRAALEDRTMRRVLMVLLALVSLASLQWLFTSASLAMHQVLDTAIVAILAYAVVRGSVLDVDVKIKLAISKSTVVALFAGLVFVASELVEQLLGVDQLVPAILAAGGIALAMRPLTKFGERLAHHLMPGVEDTDEYRTVRQDEVFQAAVESAMLDGVITKRERHMLTTLAEKLGLESARAAQLEKAALESR